MLTRSRSPHRSARLSSEVLRNDGQGIVLSADPIEKAADDPTRRAPWTIEVADISFATPNSRVEFRGRFPDGLQISVSGLSYAAASPAGGGGPARPTGKEAAFVVIADAALGGGARLRFSGVGDGKVFSLDHW